MLLWNVQQEMQELFQLQDLELFTKVGMGSVQGRGVGRCVWETQIVGHWRSPFKQNETGNESS